MEIAKIRKSFTLLTKIIKNWVPDKLPSSRFVHGDPSDRPESIFEVQKLQDGRKYARTRLQSLQKNTHARKMAPTRRRELSRLPMYAFRHPRFSRDNERVRLFDVKGPNGHVNFQKLCPKSEGLGCTVLLFNNCQVYGCARIVQHAERAPWTIPAHRDRRAGAERRRADLAAVPVCWNCPRRSF